MAFVQRCGSTHPAIVIQPPLTCQYPQLVAAIADGSIEAVRDL